MHPFALQCEWNRIILHIRWNGAWNVKNRKYSAFMNQNVHFMCRWLLCVSFIFSLCVVTLTVFLFFDFFLCVCVCFFLWDYNGWKFEKKISVEMLRFKFIFWVACVWHDFLSHLDSSSSLFVCFFDFMVLFGSWVNLLQPHYLCDAYFRSYTTHIHTFIYLVMENQKMFECVDELFLFFLVFVLLWICMKRKRRLTRRSENVSV